jgi:hypothetical protein
MIVLLALPAARHAWKYVQALARSAAVSDLAVRHETSRKFVYQQMHKAGVALYDAFLSAAPDEEVLSTLTVSKTWLRQVIVGLALICHSSYRGVVEFLRDLLGTRISVGTVHHVLQLAAQQAGVINRNQDLSGIRVGLHDEIFHDGKPVLAGVDAASTYRYLLVAAQHRDANTWGVHLLDVTEQGLKPDHTIADAGQGLRAGQKAAWGNTPCHGDVFHIQRQCEGLTNTLARLSRTRERRQIMRVSLVIADAAHLIGDPGEEGHLGNGHMGIRLRPHITDRFDVTLLRDRHHLLAERDAVNVV